MPRLLASIGLTAILLASLAGKLAATSRADTTPVETSRSAAELLQSRGMAVTFSAENVDPGWVTGLSGNCRIRIAQVSPQGWANSIVTRQAEGEKLSFAFNGRFLAEQPVLQTRLEDYRRRLLGYAGISTSEVVVSAVIMSPHCRADIIRPQDAALLSR